MTYFNPNKKGFTLIEMLLVLAVISGILIMMIRFTSQRIEETRRDKTIIEIQQILNASLAYYTAQGKWPLQSTDCSRAEDLTVLRRDGYLPISMDKNPYGIQYKIQCFSQSNAFSVVTSVRQAIEAQIISHRLPIASDSGDQVIAWTSIPGQNINNARSINFGSLYHHGACVPAPKCPKGMSQQIIVIPVSVSGLNDTGSPKVYPISSFTGYAYGEAVPGGDPKPTPSLGGKNVALCNNKALGATCLADIADPSKTLDGTFSYWRVCLNVVTAKGDTATTNMQWGKDVTLLAITRCEPNKEYTGGDFNVFVR